MKPEMIFVPMLVLVFWSFVIVTWLAYKRFSAGFSGRVKAGYFKVGESDKVPDDVKVVGRNFANLFEMPVLFYAVCISAYVTHQMSHALVVLAWAYVILRVIHSLIHVTYNYVNHRFTVYFASCLLLLVMWIIFAVNLHGTQSLTVTWPFH